MGELLGFCSDFLRKGRTKIILKGKLPRHRVVTGPTEIIPALTRLSLVGLLLSRRASLRGEMFAKELFFGIYGILIATRTAGCDGRPLLGA